MNFIRVPEIALMNCTNASITHDLGIMLMQPILQSDQGVKDEKSFLSPVNYFDFEQSVISENWTSVKDRWSMDEATASCVYNYTVTQSKGTIFQA